MHTALLAREIRRPQVARGASISLDAFMLRDPEERREEARSSFVAAMRALAIPKGEAKRLKKERAEKAARKRERKKVRVRK